MKLLVITQKVNLNDDVLGFFHDWLAEFSRQASSLSVIGLEVGETALPGNVKVLSLGKDREGAVSGWRRWRNRLAYLWRFYFYCWHERKNYDAVFVHMNQGYVIYGWPLWRLLGKKIGLWYAHGAVPFSLKIAEKLSDAVFTSTADGFRLASAKRMIVGQGIEIDKFSPAESSVKSASEPFKIISVGRISAIKNIDLLIPVAEELRRQNFLFTISLAGTPLTDLDREYVAKMKKEIAGKNLETLINFIGPITHHDVIDFYRSADLFINLSDTGSLDKAILEAMSCGLHVLTSNDSAMKILPSECLVDKDPKKIAKKIIDSVGKSGAFLRELVIANHSLSALIGKILAIYEKLCGSHSSFFDTDPQAKKNKSRHLLILLAIFFINLSVAVFYVRLPVVFSDSLDYQQAANYFQSGVVPAGGEYGHLFTLNRLLTTPLMVACSSGLGNIFGSFFAGMFAVNLILGLFVIFAAYDIIYLIYRQRSPAFWGTALIISNYCFYNFGIAYMADMGGWFFFLLAVDLALRFYYSSSQKYYYAAILASAVGILFKETGAFGLIALIALIMIGDKAYKDKAILAAKAACLFLILPAIFHFCFYLKYHFTYFDWYWFNLSQYGLGKTAHSYSLILFVKVMGWLFSFGWLIWLFGLFQEWREKNRDRVIVILALLPASLAILAWPAFLQRVDFILVPWLAIIAGFGLAKVKNTYVAVAVFIIYLIINYNVPYLLPLINLPF